MDALALAQMIFDSPWVRAIVGLLIANVLLGIAVSLYTGTFRLGAVGDWLFTRVLPYLFAWGAAKLVAYTALADFQQAAILSEVAISAFVIAALLGKLGDQLRELGVPIPRWATDKPTQETTARP